MKYLSLLLLLALAVADGPAAAQSLLLKAGPAITSTPNGEASMHPGVQVGSRVWLAEFFQVQGVIGYTDKPGFEVTMNVRPFALSRTLEPYFFSGYGLFIGGEDRRSVIPVGLGLEYDLNDRIALNAEVAARWTLFRDLGAPGGELQQLEFGVFPALGVNYTFTRSSRYDPAVIAERRGLDAGETRRSTPEDDLVVARTATTGGGTTAAPTYDAPRSGGGAAAQPRTASEGQPGVAPAQPTAGMQGEPGFAPAQPVSGEPVGVPGQGQPGRTAADPVTRQGALAGAYDVPGAQPLGSGQPASVARPSGALPSPSGQSSDMVLVPDGTFTMGLFEEDPLGLQTQGFKRVTVSSFFVDKFEVTNAEYRQWLQSLPASEREAMTPDSLAWQEAGGRANYQSYFLGQAYNDYPVVAVAWDQAQAYCEAEGKRLPTEAEWEYVARSGVSGGIYPWPGQSPQAPNGGYYANFNPGRAGYAADGYAFTAPVGAFPSSPWGIFNMSGNVAEWTLDAYTPSYNTLADFNPRWQDEAESRRMVRGGSWSSDAFYIGVGVREAVDMDDANIYTGFRCAKDLGSEFGPAPSSAQGTAPAGGVNPPAPQGGQPSMPDSTSSDQNGGGQ